ncbi:Metallo-hydrolase/oxidoreductase [Parathielavia hyrcaniae]|uniref:Metallo-hydrolase/oxidoreductase n=1 Tax=Parathielavia hyrcaniae TaxID=113614 RepID=A0AAN6PW67_9PEZI|nr:Metallo-hydrolase/oxidoreductase [Parathielavia hyrcaniae]
MAAEATPKPIRETTHPPLLLNPNKRYPLLKTATHHPHPEPTLPISQTKHHHPPPTPSPKTTTKQPPTPDSPEEEGSVYFIGNATTILSYASLRFLTDPNFLHAGDHVHLGPGVTSQRLRDPIVPGLGSLPPVDCVLLSHYHEDHFDREVEANLNRDVPIVTTPHARGCLTEQKGEGEGFRRVLGVGAFEGVLVKPVGEDDERERGDGGSGGGGKEAVRVTGMPGKHVPPGPLGVANELLGAVPPTNGWLVELGWTKPAGSAATSGGSGGEGEEGEEFETGYRIYISGDTLFVDELREIPKRLRGDRIDLMLAHLGGTTIPGPHMPLLMVTMDGRQGVQLMRLVDPDVMVPIHFDDYDVMLSSLDDFKKEVAAAGLEDRVVYLDRGEEFGFAVKK